MDNSKKPASPFYEIISMVNGVPTRFDNHKGLTKREMFAMAAMQGMLSSADAEMQNCGGKIIIENAIWYADALLAELESAK